jgi:hypothetical protein
MARAGRSFPSMTAAPIDAAAAGSVFDMHAISLVIGRIDRPAGANPSKSPGRMPGHSQCR